MFRDATHDDIHKCLVCAEHFVNHYGLDWDVESTIITLRNIIDNGVFILAEDNGNVIGGAAAIIAPTPWNFKQLYFQEMFWWVEPEYRNTSVGIKLLKHLENKAPENTTIALSILPNTNIKEETLTKLGYSLKELSYIRK
jgi:N-acetylglutamate synthase-like GNAT family acetyltransferase